LNNCGNGGLGWEYLLTRTLVFTSLSCFSAIYYLICYTDCFLHIDFRGHCCCSYLTFKSKNSKYSRELILQAVLIRRWKISWASSKHKRGCWVAEAWQVHLGALQLAEIGGHAIINILFIKNLSLIETMGLWGR
jgi:hypothetical protein